MTRQRLSLETRAQGAAVQPDYDPAQIGVGAVHFGPGAFHRAHQAAYLDQLLGADPRWGICGVSLRSAHVRDALRPQDGLYTLAVEDAEQSLRIIGAMREIFSHSEAGAIRDRLGAPQTLLVTLTVTEAGYCLGADGALDLDHPDIRADLEQPHAPRSVIGWIVEGLRLRRDASLAPFLTLSCDNLANNGVSLRRAVVALAQARDASLADWIEGEARFPNTMVDSIAPASDAAFKARVSAELGLEDAAPVRREAFVQWVIEDSGLSPQPDWASAGVIVARDVAPFARAKLRLLNGAHSSLAYIGLLAGFGSVNEAVGAPWLARFIRKLTDESIETLSPIPELDLPSYRDAILKRFENPAIRHELRQIAMDGSQKLPIRLLGTASDRLAKQAPIETHALPVAAWMRFLRKSALEGALIADPLGDQLRTLALSARDRAEEDVPHFLSLGGVFPAALASDPRFRDAVARAYATLLSAERSSEPAKALAASLDSQS
jgi:fructuronate reductase